MKMNIMGGFGFVLIASATMTEILQWVRETVAERALENSKSGEIPF